MIEGELQSLLEGFAVGPVDPATDVVTTPFSDRDGNAIRIFVRRRGSQYYLFHEKGRIFGPEKIGRFTRPEVREKLRDVLRRFDVYNINGEISTEATGENLPARMKNLIQALVVIDGMF